MNEKNASSPVSFLPARALSSAPGLTPEQTATLTVLMYGGGVIAAAAAGKSQSRSRGME